MNYRLAHHCPHKTSSTEAHIQTPVIGHNYYNLRAKYPLDQHWAGHAVTDFDNTNEK